MKNIIFLIVIAAVTCLKAQNTEPEPFKFFNTSPNDWRTNTTERTWELSASNTDGPNGLLPKEFIIGWWWGHDLRSADNLNSNMAQANMGLNWGYSPFITGGLVNTPGHPQYTNLNGKIKTIPAFWQYPSEAESIQFEPTLWVEENDKEKFKPLLSESAHSIFGFQKGLMENNPTPSPIVVTNSIYRLKLRKIESYPNGGLILSNPWKNDQFTRFTVRSKNDEDPNKCGIKQIIDMREIGGFITAYYDLIFQKGVGWFVSINFRLDEPLPNLTELDNNASILKIKVPYFTDKKLDLPANKFIKFSYIPKELNIGIKDPFASNPNIDNKYFENATDINGRGGFYFNPPLENGGETINITAGYLRNIVSAQQDQDITISAFFEYNPKKNNNPLPRYEFDDTDNPGKNTDFERLGLNVYYDNKINLSIDWLRIGNPASLAVYQGWHDNEYWHYAQRLIDFVHDKPGNCIDGLSGVTSFKKDVDINANYELFRIYGGNGHDATCIWNWGMKRYWNKLFPNMLVQSMGPELSNQYDWYVQPKDRWQSLPALKGGYASPAYYPSQNASSDNIRHGLTEDCGMRGDPTFWTGGSNQITKFSWNSGYETSLLYPSFSGTALSFVPTNPQTDGVSIIQRIREEQPFHYNAWNNTTNPVNYEEFYRTILGGGNDGGGDGGQSHGFQARWENEIGRAHV